MGIGIGELSLLVFVLGLGLVIYFAAKKSKKRATK